MKNMSDCVYSCLCGYLNDLQKPVDVRLMSLPNIKSESQSALDRIDIHIEAPRVHYGKLSGNRMGESSESIRALVQAARNIQLARFSNIEYLRECR